MCDILGAGYAWLPSYNQQVSQDCSIGLCLYCSNCFQDSHAVVGCGLSETPCCIEQHPALRHSTRQLSTVRLAKTECVVIIQLPKSHTYYVIMYMVRSSTWWYFGQYVTKSWEEPGNKGGQPQ